MISYFDLVIWTQLAFLGVVVGGVFIATQIERLTGKFSYDVCQVLGRSIFVAACLIAFVAARCILRTIHPPKE